MTASAWVVVALELLFTQLIGARNSSAATADPPAPADVLYEALHGDPETVEAGLLLSAPGRFVGRAVRTHGRLERSKVGKTTFELVAEGGRVLLRLEPQAAVIAPFSVGRSVEADGFFYRDTNASEGVVYALRAWRVEMVSQQRRAQGTRTPKALVVTLEELVYGAGRYDGKLVRVGGTYRGLNIHGDLPEATRRGARDWVLKHGHFAAWVTGREARGEGWDLTGRSLSDTDTTLEVVGVAKSAAGTVRLVAHEVQISLAPPMPVIGRALPTGDAGWAAVPPRVSFSYPIPGEALGRRGHMIVQFSKQMDPSRFEGGVRVRYEQRGVVVGLPRVAQQYRDRYRALVLTPEAPPPADADVVVELLESVLDVDGRALTPRVAPKGGDRGNERAVVERLRFRSGR